MIAVMIQTMKLNEINLGESEKNKRDSYVDASKSAFAPLFRSSASFLPVFKEKFKVCAQLLRRKSSLLRVCESCVVRLEADVSSSFRTHNTQLTKKRIVKKNYDTESRN